MLLKDVDKEKLSPMMRQYVQTKAEYPDCILFYRLGDFYEMFFDDALVVSRDLELTLTGRDCGLPERAPMCGVPYHSCELYIKRLIDLGYRVAICEQMTDPALSKGLVEREVIRVVTPGTVIETNMLDDADNNYLCSVYAGQDGAAVCVSDISTGEVSVTRTRTNTPEQEIIDLVSRYAPKEILSNEAACEMKTYIDFVRTRMHCAYALREDAYFSPEHGAQTVCSQFGVGDLAALGLPEDDCMTRAVCGLFSYVTGARKNLGARFTQLEINDESAYMQLDHNALRNLELLRTMRTGDKKGSLLWVLDSTRTPMGKRMLRAWMERPLRSPARIMARLDAVEALGRDSIRMLDLADCLDRMYDLERLMTRIVCRQAGPRDLRALCESARELPAVKAALEGFSHVPLLKTLASRMSDLHQVRDLIDRAIVEDPPAVIKDGGVIREGFDPDLDQLRSVMNGGSSIIERIGEQERERTGIKSLKVGFNRVFGYYIEVTRSYYDKVPPEYIRKQTLANAERYITQELKDAENMVLGSREKSVRLEQDLYAQVRDYLAGQLTSVQETAAAVAQLDVLVSFAETAAKNDYHKPEIAIDGTLQIRDGRHPVVEQLMEEVFVPNSAYLDTDATRLMVITGPNMSGKSTYMRQTALIVLMAQMGSFVPASYAKISVCDRIFTRVGASDDLAAGESTFMVEMKEVADILRYATKDSFVILDEVGRGTSTFDGVSIARAVAEHMATGRGLGCKTMFATHYHELISLEGEIPGVKNFSVAVRKGRDGIRFLRKIVPGGTDDSYGIDVARLAGLPNKVLSRARAVLSEMEQTVPQEGSAPQDAQMGLHAEEVGDIPRRLRQTNPDELSDAECRELLEELCGIAALEV
ncbi:MAG: DNA mismatch repair protein MutS [Oscillospiraceae bacterium]|nr:DNA mismatch repair protein MutS [Oscillospiraceae bacterium]